jgi:hypothetical protein
MATTWPKALPFRASSLGTALLGFALLASCSDSSGQGTGGPDAPDTGAGEDVVPPLPDAAGGLPVPLDTSAEAGPPGDDGAGYAEPCQQDDECASDLCVRLTAGGQGLCSEFCTDDRDCPEGSDCVLIRNSGRDAINVCLPRDYCLDLDGDGYGAGPGCAGPDCDDTDPLTYVGAPELCDGIDNACNGRIDDNVPGTNETCETGALGLCAEGRTTCESASILCRPRLTPTPEICDNLDNDCDGVVDNDPVDAPRWYADADGDRYGDPDTFVDACTRPEGFVPEAGDCDDSDRTVNPGAVEVCDGLDNNCDGIIDGEDAVGQRTFFRDEDGDGFGDAAVTRESCGPGDGWVDNDRDCDDTRADVYPGAAELCDGMDNNCNGLVDEDTAVDAPTWYRDADSDGFGDAAVPLRACTQPAGYVANDGDCNDVSPLAFPGAVEVCDGIDNNCDGSIDGGVLLTFFRDEDGDGFGSAVSGTRLACSRPDGFVVSDNDCDDTRADVFPGAPEVCDGVDNNCNGAIDESLVRVCWDGAPGARGIGVCRDGAQTCTAGVWGACTGQVLPTAEVCDNLDNNCNGLVDEAVTRACYTGPAGTAGVGLCRTGSQTCSAGAFGACQGQVLPATDVCDGLDNNCDGVVDNQPEIVWWPDRDNDGFGDQFTTGVASCTPPWPISRQNNTDCNDYTQYVNPGAPEICDGVDNDCSGAVNDICQSGCQGVANTSSYNTPGLRGYAYCRVGSNRNFDQHQNRCQAHSQLMSLARPNTETENNWLFDNRPWNFGRMYIGGVFGVSRDLASIRWRDGSVGGFTRFASGEPSGNGFCISMYGPSDGDSSKHRRWDDHGCGDNRDEGVCEWTFENSVFF